MKFTLELQAGATYADLTRRLQAIAINLQFGNCKPEHTETIHLRNDDGLIVGEWSITK